MSTFKTTKKREVPHCHVGDPAPCNKLPVVSDAKAQEASAWIEENFPRAVEVRRATYDYNCFGRAFTRSHGWFEIAETFLEDDFEQKSLSAPRVGDVVIYKVDEEISHAAVVTRVEHGEITQLISKWGGMPEVLHSLEEVPDSYGEAVELYRPLPTGLNFTAATEVTEGAEMSENVLSAALKQLTSRDVQFRLMLASTDEARERIIASLPEVRMLLERKSEAADALVEFFQQDEIQNNPDASGIALYLLRFMPSEAAARVVAHHIDDSKVSAINQRLAAQAFLASAQVQHDDKEDPFEVASRGAKAFLGRG
ncbi:MAG TPA: CHAP domain-containing protein [Pyrinomonadaceae bacterium]|jgi:hypothetical protein|nr:CHAP domain-containing protein [Pyrinomonadaceae bacterium]